MKKIFALILSAGLLAAIGITSNSCAPSAPLEVDTTRLISAPSSLSLTRGDTSQSAALALTCGCDFGPVIASYGDTSIIHFDFGDTLLTTVIQPHPVYAKIYPSALATHDTVASWIAFLYVDQGGSGTALYDTIRVTATY